MAIELKGKKVLIIGVGKTGIATAKFLDTRGADIRITDEKPQTELTRELSLLGNLRDRFVAFGESSELLSGADLIVPSPGVPPSQVLLKEGYRKSIPIMSELELAFQFVKKPVIAITGTNGKTTTTTLVGAILKEAGKKVFVGGNIGNPLISYAGGEGDADIIVLEVSSFQLQWIHTFRPDVAVLLNTTFDHIDYHGSFVDYLTVKYRIFENQQAHDLAILNADESSRGTLAKTLKSDVMWFNSAREVECGMFCDSGFLRFRGAGEKEETYPISEIALRGKHNLENVMAAIMAVRRFGVENDAIMRAIASFDGIPHRIEFVGEVKGVSYYDDSKATNIDAVARALDSFDGNIVLLMGGREKGGDYGELKDRIAAKVRKLILFGEARNAVRKALGSIVPSETALTLREAIPLAATAARAGDSVILSPGGSSFDEFRNYEERGAFFKDAVKALAAKDL